MSVTLPPALQLLTERYDPSAFELGRRWARVRLSGVGTGPVDVVLDGRTARLAPAANGRPDALLSADDATWSEIAQDVSGGMRAFRSRRLEDRYDLHLGGRLPRRDGGSGPRTVALRADRDRRGPISVTEAAAGSPVPMLHGLGATKVSFVATVVALAGSRRAIAVDLPGFGDSVKPIRARHDPAYFANVILALLDSLELERVHLVGNSMGGRQPGVAAPAGTRRESVSRRGALTGRRLA